MRATLIAAAFFANAAAGGAQAQRVLAQSCAAAGHGYQPVAATVARLGDCCAARLQCSQFLSTTTVVRPAHNQRT